MTTTTVPDTFPVEWVKDDEDKYNLLFITKGQRCRVPGLQFEVAAKWLQHWMKWPDDTKVYHWADRNGDSVLSVSMRDIDKMWVEKA